MRRLTQRDEECAPRWRCVCAWSTVKLRAEHSSRFGLAWDGGCVHTLEAV